MVLVYGHIQKNVHEIENIEKSSKLKTSKKEKEMGLRKSRYKGTNRGTKGTVVNQTLLLLP